MDTEFQDKVTRWKQLRIDCGDGAWESAREYYWDEILPDVVDRVKKNPDSNAPKEGVGVLISTLGESPQTTIIAYEILKPRYVVVVTSKQSSEKIKKVRDWIKENSEHEIEEKCWITEEVDKVDFVGLNGQVTTRIDQFYEDVKRMEYPVIIDVTGGTKLMSAAAAYTAWNRDLHCCYVNSSYDSEMRMPEPGSEFVELLPRPYQLTANRDFNTAKKHFNAGLFAQAASEFDRLHELIVQSGDVKIYRILAKLYYLWSEFEFDSQRVKIPGCNGEESILGLLDRLKPLKRQLSETFTEVDERRVSRQIEFLEQMVKLDDDSPEKRLNHLLTFYVLGRHYHERLGRMTFATLLYYRCVEGCLKLLLEDTCEGFTCKHANLEILEAHAEDFKEQYLKICNRVYKSGSKPIIPYSFGLMACAISLEVIGVGFGIEGDDSCTGLELLYRFTESRNSSVLAHGLSPVSQDEIKKCNELAKGVMKHFLEYWVEKHTLDLPDFRERVHDLGFVELIG